MTWTNILLLVLWLIGTLVFFYGYAFYLHSRLHLMPSFFQVIFPIITLLALTIALDLLWATLLDNTRIGFPAGALHMTLIMLVLINYQEIQKVVGYPYKV